MPSFVFKFYLETIVNHMYYFPVLISIARLSVQAGAAGIIVSNHGARQLDYAPATITALEEVNLLSLLLLSR